MAEATQECSMCKYWVPHNGGHVGDCKRNPPVPLFGAHAKQPGPGVPVLEYFFPQTGAAEWCGEYKPAAPVEVLPA